MPGTSSTALVVDDDIATHKALTRIGKAHDFSALAFQNSRDLGEWFQKEKALHPGGTTALCLVIDATSLCSDPGWFADERLQSLPKICIGTARTITGLGERMNSFNGELLKKPFTLERIRASLATAFARHASITEDDRNGRKLLQLFSFLTPREHEVAAMVGNGASNQEIADALEISLKTVKAHRSQVMHKTESDTIAEFVKKFQKYLDLVERPAQPYGGIGRKAAQ